MSGEKKAIREIKFISYYDDNNEVVQGMFSVIEIKEGLFIKIQTKKNILTIPWLRVLKIKEPISHEENNQKWT